MFGKAMSALGGAMTRGVGKGMGALAGKAGGVAKPGMGVSLAAKAMAQKATPSTPSPGSSRTGRVSGHPRLPMKGGMGLTKRRR
jgi:hypothetical protein